MPLSSITESSGTRTTPALRVRNYHMKLCKCTADQGYFTFTEEVSPDRTATAYGENGDGSKVEEASPSQANVEEAAVPNKKSLLAQQLEKLDRHPLEEGAWHRPTNVKIILKYRAIPWIIKTLTYGSSYDIHAAQAGEAGTVEGDHMRAVYSRAKQYPNEVEATFSFIQVVTACTASFAHGANDLGNAIGPWSVIYQTWHSGVITGKSSTVHVWMLVVGGICLVVGFVTYGYNIIRVLGNKVTYISPSRGASMELGSAITVILASQYGLPVSTTMCITGATVGVGLCNGNIHAINWKATAWIFTGWVLTIPIVGILAGCMMGIILNAPHFA